MLLSTFVKLNDFWLFNAYHDFGKLIKTVFPTVDHLTKAELT